MSGRSVIPTCRWRGPIALLGVPGLLLAMAAGPESPGGVRVLYPADRSLHAGPVTVILVSPIAATAPRVTLDGKPLPVTRLSFARTWVLPGALERTAALVGDRGSTALWVGRAPEKRGRHAVRVVGGAGVRFEIGSGKPAPGWARAYEHPAISVETGKQCCQGCHAMSDGALDTARTPAACERCHSETDVQLAHKHVAQPLARCAMCHDPHGASIPRLLVAPKEKLCVTCHSAGHSKG